MPNLLQSIIRPILRIWGIINIGWNAIKLIGFIPILILMAGDKKAENARAETQTDNGNETEAEYTEVHNSEQQWLPITLLRKSSTVKQFADPKSFWVPLFSITLAVVYAFRLLERSHVMLAGVNEYQTACPAENRRSQTSALVKLLAASVTTICIHGHLGSLTGSESWRHELCRMLEVVVSPLTSLFTMANSAWYEIATLPAFRRDSWNETVGLRYRLARMCRVLMEHDCHNSPFTGGKFYLSAINPTHVKRRIPKYGLKWHGRVLVLVILFAQYVQATVLLTRRIISHTTATFDMAMFLMVLSGLVGLVQSLIISAVNTSWIFDPETEPCVAKACQRPDCITFKTEHDIPNGIFKVVVFGYDITGIPRAILHALAGGNLQLTLERQKISKMSLWQVVITLVALYFPWESAVKLAIFTDVMHKLIYGDAKPASNEPEEKESEERTTTPTPTEASIPSLEPEKSSSNGITSTSTFLLDLWEIPIFMLGLGTIAFAIFALLYMLFTLFAGPISMYISLVEETNTWNKWDTSKGCPQLWVDGLENNLWCF